MPFVDPLQGSICAIIFVQFNFVPILLLSLMSHVLLFFTVCLLVIVCACLVALRSGYQSSLDVLLSSRNYAIGDFASNPHSLPEIAITTSYQILWLTVSFGTIFEFIQNFGYTNPII